MPRSDDVDAELRAFLRDAKEDDEVPPEAEGGEEEVGDVVPPGTLLLDEHWHSFTVPELDEDPPRKVMLWDQRIPLGDVGVLASPGAGGKTSLLVGLALHRAMGRAYMGAWVRQGSTVIVTTEDSAPDYRRKIAAWREHLGDLDLEAVAKHVHLLDLAGIPFRLIKAEFGDYISTAHVEHLAQVIKAKAPAADLIILETVSRLGGDEGNASMSALVCAAEQLAAMTGAAVILVSHVAKAVARAGAGDAYAPRGGSAITDNGRFTLTLAGLDEKQAESLMPGVPIQPERLRELLVLRVPKINCCAAPEPMVLQRIPTRWGLVLRPFQAMPASTPEEATKASRQALGEALRALADRHAALGNPITESRLSGGLYKELVPSLAKGRIASVVADAIEDGFLYPEARKGRGGGQNLMPSHSTINVTKPSQTLPAGE